MFAVVAEQLAKWSKTEIAVGFGFAITLVVGASKAAKFVKGVLSERRKEKAESLAYRARARQSFTEKDLSNARKNFIELDCANLDPTKELDLRSAVGVRESVMKVLARELAPKGTARYILILADSGMGKTTLLLNLLSKELRRRVGERRLMVLISLAREDAVERIKEVSNKSDTVLLLDAFDEDTEANIARHDRLHTIMRAAQDFQMVILTCRTQFFSSDQEIPTQVGVLRISSRQAGEEHEYTFRKIYLLPYDEVQIRRYLKKAFPFWAVGKRRRATVLVKSIGELAHRPMLLAAVPDLVRAKHQIAEVFQLYEFMVESWYRREHHWIPRDTLATLSRALAVEMVLNSGKRGSESLSSEEAHALVPPAYPIARWKLESRSFLNRDAKGLLKFSHRSIMEYFFVVAAIEGRIECLQTAWTDQMREFFFSWGRCNSSQAAVSRFSEILNHLSRQTGVFPFHSPPWERSALTANSLDALTRQSAPKACDMGYPGHWAERSLRIVGDADSTRVFEFADGLVWNIPKIKSTTANARGKASRVFNFDDIYGGEEPSSESEEPWRVTFWVTEDQIEEMSDPPPTLSQFLLLVSHLIRTNSLFKIISPDELYWLSNVKGRTGYLVNVRHAPGLDGDDRSLRFVSSVAATALAKSKAEAPLLVSLYATTGRHAKGVLLGCRVTNSFGEYLDTKASPERRGQLQLMNSSPD